MCLAMIVRVLECYGRGYNDDAAEQDGQGWGHDEDNCPALVLENSSKSCAQRLPSHACTALVIMKSSRFHAHWLNRSWIMANGRMVISSKLSPHAGRLR